MVTRKAGQQDLGMAAEKPAPPPLDDQRYPLSPTPPATAERFSSVWLRYAIEGSKLARDGRLVRLELSNQNLGLLQGSRVLQALADEGVDLGRFKPAVYDEKMAGWQPLEAQTTFNLQQDAVQRIDLKLLLPPGPPPSVVGPQEDGYFQIGIIGTKTEANLGTLWRSAFQLGAAGIFQIGCRFTQSTCDVTNSFAKIPLVEYDAWGDFVAAAPYAATWVAVEMGGEPLETFEHPKRAVYILGSEDHGIPGTVLRACHRTVALPSVRYSSFNVAVSGSIVMYDRVAKQARNETELSRSRNGGFDSLAARSRQRNAANARDTPEGRIGSRAGELRRACAQGQTEKDAGDMQGDV